MPARVTNDLFANPQSNLQFATFYCDRSWFGIDVTVVQEINRILSITRIPLAQSFIRGVINLRGDVVTLLDLRVLLGMNPSNPTHRSRNIVIKVDGELFGLWVDSVSDIVTVPSQSVLSTPSNLNSVQSKLIQGVVQVDSKLLMMLDPIEILSASMQSAEI